MTVEAAGSGGTLDSEIRDLTVPDFTAPHIALSTPRVFRARTAREFQTLVAEANAIPTPGREFSRTERLLIVSMPMAGPKAESRGAVETRGQQEST